MKGTVGEQAVADGLSMLHAKNLTEFAPLEINDEEARLAAELGEGGSDERLFSNKCPMKEARKSLLTRSPAEEASPTCAVIEIQDIDELGDWEEEENGVGFRGLGFSAWSAGSTSTSSRPTAESTCKRVNIST